MSMRVAIRDISLYERPARFVRPFRFGVVRIDAASQAFVRVELEVEGGTRAVGASAEMLVPKWFDKRPDRSPEQTVADLRRSLNLARKLYLAGDGFDTAFGWHAARIAPQVAACAAEDIPPLAAAYGPAQIDKAILDALLRALGTDFFSGMAANVAGLEARLTPDLTDAAIVTFLADRRPPPHVAIRHTVGLDDDVEGDEGIAAIAGADSLRYFKLKLGGDPSADAARLARIGRELDIAAQTATTLLHVTLDANEQYANLAALADLVERLDRDAALAPIASRLLYIEQPMPRETTLQTPLGELARHDFIIDEADDSYAAFPTAKALGYRGISSKSCKGLYKSILNRVRAANWTDSAQRYFVAAEDLTCQAGLGVQQDLALGALIGVSHAERNGHHYVDGFDATPQAEQQQFLAAHPDLYTDTPNGIRLATGNGRLATASLTGPGFASRVHPDWSSLDPLQTATKKIAQEQAL